MKIFKNFQPQGMSLLEVLAAIGILSFMFVFIAQFLKVSHRQSRKIKEEIQFKNSISHSLDLIRQDFQGVAYFFDIHANLNQYFYREEGGDREEEASLPSSPLSPPASQASPSSSKETRLSPVYLSPFFTFQGSSNELEFVSYTFSKSEKSSRPQWIKIRYFVEDCRGEGKGTCLFRSASRYWEKDRDMEPEELLTLMKNLESIDFSYSVSVDLNSDKWESNWSSGFYRSSSLGEKSSLQWPIPRLVKMELERQEKKERFLFFISKPYLRAWNPLDRGYEGFPKLNPPKPKKERGSLGDKPQVPFPKPSVTNKPQSQK